MMADLQPSDIGAWQSMVELMDDWVFDAAFPVGTRVIAGFRKRNYAFSSRSTSSSSSSESTQSSSSIPAISFRRFSKSVCAYRTWGGGHRG